MIRRLLRKIPVLYKFARVLHVFFIDIKRFPLRIRKGICLKNRFNQISEKVENRIWYFCVPEHNNLGDFAQYLCIKKWVKDNYKEYECIELPTEPLRYDYCGLMKHLKKLIRPQDIIIFQSGYTSNDYHIDEKVHHKVVATFSKNAIVFFPQTVKYSSKKSANKAASIYNRHKKLIFLARDKKSFEIAKKYFRKTKVILFPDIVTSLIGTQNYEYLSNEREGIMFCIRNDSEKLYADSDVKNAFKNLVAENKTDWCDTTLPKGIQCQEETIREYFERFSKYKVVVTDRFHGTIFSLIATTPVVVLKTNDHKVAEGAEWFLDAFPDHIRKAEKIDNACDLTNEILSTPHCKVLKPFFKEQYYDKLKVMIEELRVQRDS